MLKLLITTALALSSATAWGLTKEKALEVAKSNLTLAHDNIFNFVTMCRHYEDACQINNQEYQIIHWVDAELVWHVEHFGRFVDIQYDSESANPGSFLIDGQVRLAKTKTTRGSPLVYNTDMMIQVQPDGSYQPVEFGQFVTSLVHELGHHQASMVNFNITHELLDGIGLKVVRLMTERTRLIRIPPAIDPRIARDAMALIRFIDIDYLDAYRTRHTLIFLEGDAGADWMLTQDLPQQVRCLAETRSDGPLETPKPLNVFLESYRNVQFKVSTAGRVEVSMEIVSAGMMCAFSDNTFSYQKGYGPGRLTFYYQINGEGRLDPDKSAARLEMITPADREEWNNWLKAGKDVVREFAYRNGLGQLMEGTGLVDGAVFYKSKEKFDEAVMRLSNEPSVPPKTTSAVINRVLHMVTYSVYNFIFPFDHFTQLEETVAYELGRALHLAAVNGDKTKLGPLWFTEGVATAASGKLYPALPYGIDEVERILNNNSPRNFQKHGVLVGMLLRRKRLSDLISMASQPDFNAKVLEILRRPF